MIEPTPFSNPTGVQMNSQGYGTVSYTDDKKLNVLFYTRSVHNPAKSQASGAPVYENKVFVRIQQPGEMLNVVDKPAKDEDTKRWPQHWQSYLHNRTQIPEGTPIDLLFPNDPARSDALKSRGVYTIQQLANLSQTAMDNVGMGAQEYVNRAKKYIESANDGSQVLALLEEGKKKDLKISRLELDIQSLKDQLNQLIKDRANPSNINDKGYDVQAARINSRHISNEIAHGAVTDSIGLTNMVQSDGSLMAPTIPGELDFDDLPATPSIADIEAEAGDIKSASEKVSSRRNKR
jgi:hypothetical protein